MCTFRCTYAKVCNFPTHSVHIQVFDHTDFERRIKLRSKKYKKIV